MYQYQPFNPNNGLCQPYCRHCSVSTINLLQHCTGALTQATAPTGGTGAYTYQWQDSPDNVTFTNIGGATASGYSPPVLNWKQILQKKSYQRKLRYRKLPSILITVYANLTPGSVESAQTICYNTAPAQLTQITAPSGGNRSLYLPVAKLTR